MCMEPIPDDHMRKHDPSMDELTAGPGPAFSMDGQIDYICIGGNSKIIH